MQLAPGVLIAGKYQLERPLARGGMGSVWVAQHTQLRVPLAIKFMEPAYAASAVGRTRFEREATASAQIRHPNVVHVQDYGVEGDLPYIVMELLIGEDLGKRLKRHRRLSLFAAATILGQVAKALRRAHEAGFIHRDLKPSNIFLARNEDDEEMVKLLDFGIAKQLTSTWGNDSEATKTGEIVGSPSYMSPEQIRGAKDIDARADVWSVGVILFRALTGRLPFSGETTMDIIANILTTNYPKATEIAPDLPPSIDEFFARALAPDREARFASIRALAEGFSTVTRQPMPSMPLIEGSHLSLADYNPGSGPATPPSIRFAPGDATPASHSFPSVSGYGTPAPSSAYPQASGFTTTRSTSPSVYPPPIGYPLPSDSVASAIVGHPAMGMAADPLSDVRTTMQTLRRPPGPAPAESLTLAPSGGTLTVSPSITGADFGYHAPKRPVAWWVFGGGSLIGVGLGLVLIFAGRSEPSEKADATTASATTRVLAAPATPTAPAATLAPAPLLPPTPTAEALTAPSTEASAAPSSSAKAKAKTPGTARPPTTGPSSKKKDWGI